jgi:hypothetical protein
MHPKSRLLSIRIETGNAVDRKTGKRRAMADAIHRIAIAASFFSGTGKQLNVP